MLRAFQNKKQQLHQVSIHTFLIVTIEEERKKNKKLIIKGKVRTIGRVSKMFQTLREESEVLLKIKNMAPDGKLPRGLLLEGKPAIRNALKQFNLAKELDKVNEKRPKKK